MAIPLLALCLMLFGGLPAAAAEGEIIPLDDFADGIHHWRNRHGGDYARYQPQQVREIADNLLLYQRDNGGWIENRDPTRILAEAEKTQLKAAQALPQASFDNRNIYAQVKYLGAAYSRLGDERYREAALRGLEFILRSQLPQCGGWPHTLPASQSYHGHLTIADEVTSGVLSSLRLMSGSDNYAFILAELRQRIQAAIARGDDCLLRLQVRQQGQLSAWAGQYHAQTLLPAQGRKFELPALVAAESVAVVRYLMSIPEPTPQQIQAIEAAVLWFQQVALHGWRLETRPLPEPVRYPFHIAHTDRLLLADPDAPLLWARFYDLHDNSVVLANRQGERLAHYRDIEHERRTGYDWYGRWPAKLLERDYPAWCARLGRSPQPGPDKLPLNTN